MTYCTHPPTHQQGRHTACCPDGHGLPLLLLLLLPLLLPQDSLQPLLLLPGHS
jgi:hypothetical protein